MNENDLLKRLSDSAESLLPEVLKPAAETPEPEAPELPDVSEILDVPGLSDLSDAPDVPEVPELPESLNPAAPLPELTEEPPKEADPNPAAAPEAAEPGAETDVPAPAPEAAEPGAETDAPVPAPEAAEPGAETDAPAPAPEAAEPGAETDAPAPAPEAAEPGAMDEFGRRAPLPYHQRAYLLYGGEPEAEALDLDGTIDFLRGLGFDGGELRQAREGKDFSEAMKRRDPGSGNKMTCSYCGSEISGVDYYRMPDGRMRCNTCSRTLVKTKEELSSIYQRVLDNLDALFGASINVPVDLAMLDERSLKKKLKRPLSEVDDKSILILGVAVNRRKKYSIYLENGAPRISLIATFAHELTHIWQYTHWTDPKAFPKRKPKERLLLYEGMAKWAEIQYLYLVGETAVAKREEEFTRSRQDEYGIGFRLYENRYPLSRDAMVCGETPFRTDGYPIE